MKGSFRPYKVGGARLSGRSNLPPSQHTLELMSPFSCSCFDLLIHFQFQDFRRNKRTSPGVTSNYSSSNSHLPELIPNPTAKGLVRNSRPLTARGAALQAFVIDLAILLFGYSAGTG